MPSWKKLVTSGSDASIPSVSPSGDFTIDAGGDIVLDADGADILLKDGGTHFGSLKRVTSDLVIKAETQDKDIVFKGNDGGSTITAMTMDMSEGGKVGIGTTSPLYALHVEAGNDLPAKFSNDGDRARLLINDNDTEGYVIVQNSKFSIGQANSVSTNNLTIDGSGNVGIGDTSPNAKLEVVGSTIFGNTPTATHKFTGSLDISGSVDNATPTLKVHGSGSGIFEVKGTNGTLFSVNDIMEGSIFSANTIAGIPVIEAFSDQKVTLGSPSAPVTITALSSSMDVSGSLRAVPKTDSLTGANNLDLSKNTNFNITITGNITLTPIGLNGRDGQSGIITLIQDSSGGHSITLNSLFKTPRGDSIAFDTTADGISLMSYYVINASNVAVNYLGPFS